MYIKISMNNGYPYIRVVESYRPEDNPKQVKEHTICNVGPVSKYDDGKPDFINRLKESFKNGNPIIDSLGVYCATPQKIILTLEADSLESQASIHKFANVFLDKIMESLTLDTVCKEIASKTRIKYDFYGFVKLMTYGRLLDPVSKFATVRQNNMYFEHIIKYENFNGDNIYDSLELIYLHKQEIIQALNDVLTRKAARNTDLVYYDVTNFYFETQCPDDDVYDDNGDTIKKGLRKYGVSKEQRRLPIVQMGMFMDNNGLPISIEMFPGNTLDFATFIPAVQRNVDGLLNNKFILVGDRGICNYKNIAHLISNNNGYIVAKSLAKSKQEECEWAYSDKDYTQVNENFKYKSRITSTARKDENGKTITINEKVVVYWSKKIYDKQVHENKAFLDFLKRLESSPNAFRITKFEKRAISGYIKKDKYVDIVTGEIIPAKNIKAMLDNEKIDRFKKTFGYYQIVTSETDMPDLEVISKYGALKQIEDQFRTMKSTMEARPMYVRTPEHIEAHMLIVLISLILFRIIQSRLADATKDAISTQDSNWSYVLTTERIKDALNAWLIGTFEDKLFWFCRGENNNLIPTDVQVHRRKRGDVSDAYDDLAIILKAFGISISNSMYTKTQLNDLLKKMQVF